MTALRGPTQRRGVVALTDAGIEGCATFSYTPSPGHLDIDYGLECRAFFATTGRALRSLLAYARSFRGVGRWITFAGPPNDPTSLLLPEIAVEPAFRYPWMLRILDVPIAFAARGYPAIDASVTFAVADRLFPENRGPWTIQVRGGAGTVSSGGTPASEPIPIGALSSMFSGHLTPRDAARLGYLHGDDPAIAGLAAMFNGPDPWCPFFF